ncbi:MAG: CPBP family intramembrane glutamic endopeptidase, partial [Synechococcaceae cyanobacterium]|nr:CPBP family intramembrane glutamic endopeptidase [Synechococcaceae cyanobacterium]
MSERQERTGPLGWLPTLLYIPLLYGAGWVLVRPLALIGPPPPAASLALIGTAVSFALFLLSLPRWLAWRWGERHPWRVLGLAGPAGAGLAAFARGLLTALLLLLPLVLLLVAGGWARWQGMVTPPRLANALALVLGVGLAEELVFRGWLWGELRTRLGRRPRADQQALEAQAVLFSLVHTR